MREVSGLVFRDHLVKSITGDVTALVDHGLLDATTAAEIARLLAAKESTQNTTISPKATIAAASTTSINSTATAPTVLLDKPMTVAPAQTVSTSTSTLNNSGGGNTPAAGSARPKPVPVQPKELTASASSTTSVKPPPAGGQALPGLMVFTKQQQPVKESAAAPLSPPVSPTGPLSTSRPSTSPLQPLPSKPRGPGHRKNGSGGSNNGSGSVDKLSGDGGIETTAADSGKKTVTCVKVFSSDVEGDLNLKVGDVAEILEEVDENWYKGKKTSDGVSGIFPKKFVSGVTTSKTSAPPAPSLDTKPTRGVSL